MKKYEPSFYQISPEARSNDRLIFWGLGILTAVVLFFLTKAVYADDAQILVDLEDPEQAALAADIDSVRAVRLSTAAQARTAFIDSVCIDSILTTAGVSVLPDTRDDTWVQIDIPVVDAEGFEKAFWTGVIDEFVADGAQLVSTGRVRTGQNAAIRGLLRLRAVLSQ